MFRVPRGKRRRHGVKAALYVRLAVGQAVLLGAGQVFHAGFQIGNRAGNMLQESVFIFLAFHGLARAGQFGKNHLILGRGRFKTFFQFQNLFFQFFQGAFVLGRLGRDGFRAGAVQVIGGRSPRKRLLFEFFQKLGYIPVSVKLVIV